VTPELRFARPTSGTAERGARHLCDECVPHTFVAEETRARIDEVADV
jgi:hypothetical protein